MLLLPLKALRKGRRGSGGDEEDESLNASSSASGPVRRTRGVVLEISTDTPKDEADVMRSKTVKTTEGTTPSARGTALTPSWTMVKRMSMHGTSPSEVTRMQVGRKTTTFAPSPMNSCQDITPYSKVYGVHPAFFDFDRTGHMAFTAHGAYEFQRGAIQMTPTSRGVAMVVAGSPTSSPNTSDLGSPASVQGVWGNLSPSANSSPTASFPVPPLAPMPYSMGEQVIVLTDDGRTWMDAQIIGVFPQDCEAEGYSIPGGTVKVQFQLGMKWVMPTNLEATLRKKPAAPAANVYNFIPQTRSPYVNLGQQIYQQAQEAHLPQQGRQAQHLQRL